MGLLNANRIVERFQRGVYNRRPTSYVISVDGELIRYKGMVSSNMTRHDAEEAVAHTSYAYLVHVVLSIERYMDRRAREVVVFMDGARVANKTTSRPECSLDVSLIRTTFTRLCAEHGYRVHALAHGESELQMYLTRDRTVSLNILLTRDSDMIPICYDHQPAYYCATTGARLTTYEACPLASTATDQRMRDGRERSDGAEEVDDDDDDDDTTFGVRSRRVSAGGGDYTRCARIVDLNSTYGEDVSVVDSCAWFVCGSSCKPMLVIGFDACARRIGYSDVVFRAFTAMCGTDFTAPMLTPSMFTGFFSAADEDEKNLINGLTEPVKVVASIIYLGLKGGGVLKRGGGKNVGMSGERRLSSIDVSAVNGMVSIYYEYVRTGVMAAKRIPTFDSVSAVHRLVYAMRANVTDGFGADRPVKRQLVNWANSVPLHRCLENLETHLDGMQRCIASAGESNGQGVRTKRRRKSRPSGESQTKRRRGKNAADPVVVPYVHFMADAVSVLRSLHELRTEATTTTRPVDGEESGAADEEETKETVTTDVVADRNRLDPMISGAIGDRPPVKVATTGGGLVMTFSDISSDEDDCLDGAPLEEPWRPMPLLTPPPPLQPVYELEAY